ncbi:YqgQ family protein [Weissella diestrammenae]|uniref:YqgQ family protein n=1 Tax=Weissella diestrammenae TaxID=1162633 RepID=A0A7G9T7M0_9LACO|nr:YqgQ family protein [Weissella diestrammenae]MCM0582751.1 YqgQ family protein [Weissella diestrammenae]QNN76095.1 YqgQ family protein [Weissella diestrammenae]
MRTFKDVLNLLKMYDIYIHVGKRIWDIELAAIEIDNLYRADLISAKDYARIKLVLAHEHRMEMEQMNLS